MYGRSDGQGDVTVKQKTSNAIFGVCLLGYFVGLGGAIFLGAFLDSALPMIIWMVALIPGIAYLEHERKQGRFGAPVSGIEDERQSITDELTAEEESMLDVYEWATSNGAMGLIEELRPGIHGAEPKREDQFEGDDVAVLSQLREVNWDGQDFERIGLQGQPYTCRFIYNRHYEGTYYVWQYVSVWRLDENTYRWSMATDSRVSIYDD